MVDVLDYDHHGVCGINEASLVLPTMFYDAMFNAYHHKAVEHIFRYPIQYERGCLFCSQIWRLITPVCSSHWKVSSNP